MANFKMLAALAISAAFAVATPVMAQRGSHGGGGWGGGTHAGGASLGGGFRGAAMSSGGIRSAAVGNNFRNAQASIAPSQAGRSFASPGRFTNGYGHDWRHGHRPGIGFAAGLAAGSALGYGYGDYYDGYYGDDYAYNDYDGYYNDYYGSAEPGYAVSSPGYVISNDDNSGYCAQRYKSYDPASGTYLGYDGQRHPCQ
jgi:hypothetical protein